MEKLEAGLYLHVPFCTKKCPYCDFFSIPVSYSKDLENTYLKAIKKELKLLKEFLPSITRINNINFITFYAGGGTPSLLSPEFYESLFNFLAKEFNFSPKELTLEANPETLSLEKLKGFYQAGFNRLSLGVQSFFQKGLNFLGRIHTPKQIAKTINQALKAGFSNLSLDFIFGWKGQGEKTLKKEILKALRFHPSHFSFYELTIEKNTPFYFLYHHKFWISEKKLEKLYKIIEETLGEWGYERYEISNYALPGFECKHNLLYWKVKPYLGLGPSAVSRISNLRWENPCNINLYYHSIFHKNRLPLQIVEILDKLGFAKEYIFMGLRLKEGINLKILKEKYGVEIKLPILTRLEAENLIKIENQRLFLTFKGKLLHNQIVLFLWENLL